MKRKIKISILILVVIVLVLLLAALITGGMILLRSIGSSGRVTHLIVLGTTVEGTKPSPMLNDRIEAAAQYMQAHPHVIAVVTGGKADAENISEAQCMYNGLVALGIEGDRILLEDQATTTVENFRFSLALLEAELGHYPQKLGVLSSEFHLLRASMLAKSHGIDVVTIPATTSDSKTFATYFLREILMVWYDGSKLAIHK